MPSFATRSRAEALASGRPNIAASQFTPPVVDRRPVGSLAAPGGSTPSAHSMRSRRAAAWSSESNRPSGYAPGSMRSPESRRHSSNV
jgi:hypothetical protein